MTIDLASYIRDVPDFPSPGILFKDITPLLASPEAFRAAVRAIAATLDGTETRKIAGVEARGFVFGAPVAAELGLGFIPIRKAGKLPGGTARMTYDLEYGTATVEVHADAVQPGECVAIVDDVLATGGTAAATIALLEGIGAEVSACAFLLELEFLGGRRRLEGTPVRRVLAF